MEKRINTEVIDSTAESIRQINDQLAQTLAESKSTIESLTSVWTGQAADTTVGAYRAFDAKYTQEYRDMIEAYVTFLKNVASAGYQDTEQKATRLADMI